MNLRTFETKCKSVSVKDLWIQTCCKEHHSVPLTYPPSVTCLSVLYLGSQELSKDKLLLGCYPRLAPGKWERGVHLFPGAKSEALKAILCHHIWKYSLLVLRLSLCRQLAGASQEETSLFLSDCFVIYITNEPFCFRNVKQASINEQFLKLKLRQSSSFHSRDSPENPLYSIEMQLV